MPEPLIHFAIPLAALILAGAGYRKAIPVSIFALTPDIDALFLIHRSQSHSLIPLAAVTVTSYLLLRRTKYAKYIALASLGVISHIMFDIFSWYTPALWPIWDQSVRLIIDLNVHIASPPTLIFQPQILTIPTVFEPFKTVDAPLFTSEGLAIAMTLILPTLYKPICDKLSRKNPSPEPKHNPTLAKV